MVHRFYLCNFAIYIIFVDFIQISLSFKLQRAYTIPNPKTNCLIVGGPLTLFDCDNGYEIHNLTQLVNQGTFTNYTTPVRINNQKIQNPHLYRFIDGKNKVSFVVDDTSTSYEYNIGSNTFKTLANENYTTKALQDIVFLDETLMYRDDLLNYIYFIDRKTMQGKFEARHKNYQFNFDVTRKENSSTFYQVFACTYNHTATDNICNYFEINQGISPITVQLKFNWYINDHCGDSVRIIRSFIVVSCWQYKNNTGRIDVYNINQNQGLQLIKSFECGYLECYLGRQIGIRDLRDDHIQIYYTLYSLNGISQLDMINVMRFYYNEDNKYYYVKNVSENIISIDTALNRNLSFGVQESYLLMKYIQLQTVLYSPICNYTQYFNGQTCVPCLSGQINMQPNTGLCEYCGAPLSYSWTSFENLLRTQYCNNYYSFSLSMIQSDGDQQKNTQESTSLEPWQISLIIVLPSLFLIILVLGFYCCQSKKDMQIITTQIDNEEKLQISRQQSQQIYNYQLDDNKQDFIAPIKILKNKFHKKVDTIGSQNDFDNFLGPIDEQNKQENDDDVEIVNIGNSFQNDQRLKPQALNTAQRYFQNKNFPYDQQSEEDTHTLQQMDHSRQSSNTERPSIYLNGKKQHQTPQIMYAFITSPRKELKEWIKQDPKFIEATSCIFCYQFFKLVDNIIQMQKCQKKIKHMAHSVCLEKAINQKQINNMDCKICKTNYSIDQPIMVSPFENDNQGRENFYKNVDQSTKRQLKYDDV